MSSGGPTTYRELAEVLERMPSLLYDARRARGLSLRQAAVSIGIGPNTVYRIEQGGVTGVETAAVILRWLDQTPRDVDTATEQE